jgi:DNA-binding transcriptional ArsR family regulator
MTDHSSPDYELAETMAFDSPDQFKALFEETRIRIADLLLERAATIKELSDTLDIPKGTIGHHISVLLDAGLIRQVRTKKVRAIEAKYYGRTARTFLLSPGVAHDVRAAPDYFLSEAADEFAKAAQDHDPTHEEGWLSTLRYARIPEQRAAEWSQRFVELTQEFAAQPRGGDTTYGLLVAMYPTDRPHLPDKEPTA